VTLFHLLLLCLVAVTVVLLIRVVGLILVIALLTLPAAVAAQYAATLGRIMVVATALGTSFAVAGLAVAYDADLPAGATIILIAGTIYLASTLWQGARRRLARAGGS
jgi:zinc transport system permease protein